MNQLGFCRFSFEPSMQYVLVGQAQDEDGPVAALKLLSQSTTCCTFAVQQVSGICYRRIDALRMSHLMLFWARAQIVFALAHQPHNLYLSR